MYRILRTKGEMKKLKPGKYLFCRLEKPEEVVSAILFLASDETFCTSLGEVIMVCRYF